MEKALLLAAVVPFGLGFGGGADAPAGDPDVVFVFEDPEIVESSGLVARDGLFATVNDSGDSARVFTVDPGTGRTVGVSEWDAEPVDIEALAPVGEAEVFVGDIGDNAHQRDSIAVTRVPIGEGAPSGPATTYQLTYPDRAHDAEALLVHPRTGQVLVVAKEFIGRLYAAPERLSEDGPNRLEQIGEVLPIATDGAFFPDGDHLVLRGYNSATVYRWPSLKEVGSIDLPSQPQGEGIAVDERGEVYLSTEGQFSEVLRVALPERVRAEIDRTPVQGEDQGGDGPDGGGQVVDRRDQPGEAVEQPLWPWVIGGAAGAVIIVVLLRSLRPR